MATKGDVEEIGRRSGWNLAQWRMQIRLPESYGRIEFPPADSEVDITTGGQVPR